MENTELKKILSEITDHTNKGMAANLTIKAIRDTIARYPHDPVEHTIIRALLEQLEGQVTEFSSIWWRLREIEKLGKEGDADSTDSADTPADPIKDGEEVTDDDLPFC
jgi:hypothetical protein